MGRHAKPRPSLTTEQTATRNALVVSVVRLTWREVKRSSVRLAANGYSIEDAVQECLVRLLHAAEKFEPERGLKFTTLAYADLRRCISALCVPLLRKRLWGRTVDGNAYGSNGYRQAEVKEDVEPERLTGAMRRLDGRLQRLLRLRFWDGLTYEQCGRELHCSKQRVQQLLADAGEQLSLELKRIQRREGNAKDEKGTRAAHSRSVAT